MNTNRSRSWWFVVMIGLSVALWPAWAFACDIGDPGACIDDAWYTLWYGAASLGFFINRTLLILTYQLDTLRWWLVDVAFQSAYNVTTQVVSPFVLPFAISAILIGCLSIAIFPLFGHTSIVNVRQALVWVVLAPMLLTATGPLVVQLEQLRSDFGNALFQGIGAIAPGAIFGATGTDMGRMTELYPANPCGASLVRHFGTGVRIDDTSAAMLWADAGDIHCPEARGSDRTIPDQWYEAEPTGPGYATQQPVRTMDVPSNRAHAVAQIQRGAIQTFMGLGPSTLAALDALLQLVFAFCLLTLWIGFPIGLLFVFFSQSTGAVTGLFRMMLGVMQTSWSSSALLGMVFACLRSAAELRNTAAYVGFALAALIFTVYLLGVAVDLLKICINTLNRVIKTGTGLSATSLIAGTVDLGAVAMTGGTGAALAGIIGARQTGSITYGLASSVGSLSKGVSKVGSIAAAMGMEHHPAVAGCEASRHLHGHGGLRAFTTATAHNARHTDADGLTMRDRADMWRIQCATTAPPTVIEELETLSQLLHPSSMRSAIQNRVDQTGTVVRNAFGGIEDAISHLNEDVEERGGGVMGGIRTLDTRFAGKQQAYSWDARQRKVKRCPRRVQSLLPPDAVTELRDHVAWARLLLSGYSAQENPNNTVTIWKDDDVSAAHDENPNQLAKRKAIRRLELIKDGLIKGDIEAAREEIERLDTVAADTADGADAREEGREDGAALPPKERAASAHHPGQKPSRFGRRGRRISPDTAHAREEGREDISNA